jgi:hypothetical protein
VRCSARDRFEQGERGAIEKRGHRFTRIKRG